jgi:hypothetical protein
VYIARLQLDELPAWKKSRAAADQLCQGEMKIANPFRHVELNSNDLRNL